MIKIKHFEAYDYAYGYRSEALYKTTSCLEKDINEYLKNNSIGQQAILSLDTKHSLHGEDDYEYCSMSAVLVYWEN